MTIIKICRLHGQLTKDQVYITKSWPHRIKTVYKCKQCLKEARERYIKKYPERYKKNRKAAQKIYGDKNKEKRSAYHKEWVKKNKDKIKEYKKRRMMDNSGDLTEESLEKDLLKIDELRKKNGLKSFKPTRVLIRPSDLERMGLSFEDVEKELNERGKKDEFCNNDN